MHIVLAYLGVIAGIFFEGEMIMVSSVIAAHHGYLNLWAVIIIGIVGTYASDTMYFYIGRKRGKAWLEKNEKHNKKIAKIDHYLNKYPILIFILYRFVYGFRTVAPLVIGASNSKTSRFLFYSALSTLIWAVTYTVLGYWFGAVIKRELGHIQHIEKFIIGGLVLIGIIAVIVHLIRKKKRL